VEEIIIYVDNILQMNEIDIKEEYEKNNIKIDYKNTE
jgi:hypothetical protein